MKVRLIKIKVKSYKGHLYYELCNLFTSFLNVPINYINQVTIKQFLLPDISTIILSPLTSIKPITFKRRNQSFYGILPIKIT